LTLDSGERTDRAIGRIAAAAQSGEGFDGYTRRKDSK
jgi:hypothetical protein